LIAINEKRQLARPAAAECFNSLDYKGFGRIRTGRGCEWVDMLDIRSSGALLALLSANWCINCNICAAAGPCLSGVYQSIGLLLRLRQP